MACDEGMVTHENTDISIAAISLLQEMTDVDLSSGDDERASVMSFVRAFEAGQGLELIVQNLSRLGTYNDNITAIFYA
jgi:beta-catenin-like protein 1